MALTILDDFLLLRNNTLSGDCTLLDDWLLMRGPSLVLGNMVPSEYLGIEPEKRLDQYPDARTSSQNVEWS